MYKRLCVCRSYPEAGMVYSLLRANGYEPLDVQASAHCTLAGADQGYYVEVPESAIPAAREFLAENGYEKNLWTWDSEKTGGG